MSTAVTQQHNTPTQNEDNTLSVESRKHGALARYWSPKNFKETEALIRAKWAFSLLPITDRHLGLLVTGYSKGLMLK